MALSSWWWVATDKGVDRNTSMKDCEEEIDWCSFTVLERSGQNGISHPHWVKISDKTNGQVNLRTKQKFKVLSATFLLRKKLIFNFLGQQLRNWENELVSLCNGYWCNEKNWWPEFKSRTGRFELHFALMPLEKAWIHLFSPPTYRLGFLALMRQPVEEKLRILKQSCEASNST